MTQKRSYKQYPKEFKKEAGLDSTGHCNISSKFKVEVCECETPVPNLNRRPHAGCGATIQWLDRVTEGAKLSNKVPLKPT